MRPSEQDRRATAGVNINESRFKNRHGVELYRRTWHPAGEARACILIVHGLAEHCARYDDLAAAANQRGYVVCSSDLPGHGRSEGHRTFIERFENYVDSVDDLLSQVQDEFPDKPVFIIGHSMGGLITTAFLLRRQEALAGAILSGAALETPEPPGAGQLLLMRMFSVLLPKMGAIQLDARGVSRDPQVVANYVADPLNYGGKVCARTLAELFSAMQRAREEANNITLPLLILHGAEDKLTAVSGSSALRLHRFGTKTTSYMTSFRRRSPGVDGGS